MHILKTVRFVILNPNLFPRLFDRVVRNRCDDSKFVYMIPRLYSYERAYFARHQLYFTNYPNIRGNTQP